MSEAYVYSLKTENVASFHLRVPIETAASADPEDFSGSYTYKGQLSLLLVNSRSSQNHCSLREAIP